MSSTENSEFLPVRVLRERLSAIDDPVLRGKIDAAVEMTRRALDLYGNESVALSFNGGKDSTVLLHLLRLAVYHDDDGDGEGQVEEEEDGGVNAGGDSKATTNNNTNGLRGVRSFYFDTSAPAAAAAGIVEERSGNGGGGGASDEEAASGQQQQQQQHHQPGDFREVAAFVRATDAAYRLGVDYLTDRDFKRGLERYCAGGGGDAGGRKRIAAILLGTRRGDPNADGQDHFCPSSRGWPPFLRVNPVLDWGYGDVWRFLRAGGLPYCSLYDRGYTSLGSPATTAPNAALRRADGSFAPAHELADGRLERQGRRQSSAKARREQRHDADAPAASSVDGGGGDAETAPAASTRARYAVVVLVGDELLAGRVRDSNGPFLCGELRAAGWAVRRVVVVPDDVESVALAVAAASRDADVVLTSGGVGPTRDDVTMEGVAGAVAGGRGGAASAAARLVRHPEAERALVEHFGASRVTPAHLKMADVPGSGDVELIWMMDEDDQQERSPFPLVRVDNIFVLPGVPSLLRRKWAAVKRRLAAMDDGGTFLEVAAASAAAEQQQPLLPYRSATLRLHAPDEAAVAPCLDALAEDERGAGVMIGSYPVDVWGDAAAKEDGGSTATTPMRRTTTLRVVLESKDSAGLDAAVDCLAELLRERLGEAALLGVERNGGGGGVGGG